VTAAVECPPAIRFSVDDAEEAADAWGFNCGPAAICAVLELTPSELRPSIGDFESKGYTNPTLMFDILSRVAGGRVVNASRLNPAATPWPQYGLARVQWEGPWTTPGVPMRVRYRHTHWVGVWNGRESGTEIFDVNCTCVGGWVPLCEWRDSVVPWLLKEAVPKANGRWHLTHGIEISRQRYLRQR
jgi:hypothetical protein